MHEYTFQDIRSTSVDMPDDAVEERDAANQNVPDEAACNTANWAANRVGNLYLVEEPGLVTAASGSLARNDTTSYSDSECGYIIVNSAAAMAVVTGDVIEVHCDFHGSTNYVGAGHVLYDLYPGVVVGGVNYAAESASRELAGFAGSTTPLNMSDWYRVTRTGIFTLSLRCAWQTAPGSEFVYINGPLRCFYKHYRPSTPAP